jgi:hypothetical protein
MWAGIVFVGLVMAVGTLLVFGGLYAPQPAAIPPAADGALALGRDGREDPGPATVALARRR